MYCPPANPEMHYALARWEDLRAIAAEREVIAVWWRDIPGGHTWITFKGDAIRAVEHWAGRNSVDSERDSDHAYFVIDHVAAANIAANLSADGLHLVKTHQNRPQYDPGVFFPWCGTQ